MQALALVGLVMNTHAQLFQPSFTFLPSFAASPLPNIPLGFPAGFSSQQLFMPTSPFALPPAKKSKKSSPGVYNPNPLPSDPAASPTITRLLTSAHDMPVSGKGPQAIKALYDQGSFRSFNMEMSPQNIAIINQDPTQELQVHCRVTIDYNTPQARVFNDFAVGCGYKGSVGSLRVCLDEYHHDNHICRKLSFRINARTFLPKNGNHSSAPLFYGMQTLEFGGMPVDLSMMSERTAYNLMQSLGMTASLAAHAKLFLNGKYLGLFSFVQPIDEEFTEMHFAKDTKKGKGGLYKDLWLNPLHMKDFQDTHKGGAKEDAFLREVMTAIQTTSLYGGAPQQFFNKYFDTQSLIDLTAFNTVIGNTDDWRQRHNFFLYVRHDLDGTKKLVWIPWDYDRIYDTGADTRGALKGSSWWDIQDTATPSACNQAIQSTQTQAATMGGDAARIQWNKDILDQFPPDINVPVTCDKLTQLMANALGKQIRQRTRQMASQISMTQIKAHWATWNAQIQTALSYDPSGPTYSTMIQQQGQFAQHITDSEQKALTEANLEDGIALPPSSSFPSATDASNFFSDNTPGWTTVSAVTLPSFTPRAQVFAPFQSFAPVQSFVPAFSSSFVIG